MISIINKAIENIRSFINEECGLEASLEVSRNFPDLKKIVVHSYVGLDIAELIPVKTIPFEGVVGMIEIKINSTTLRIRLINNEGEYYWENPELFLKELKSNLMDFELELRKMHGI